MPWQTPVTDRTAADVAARNAKGTLNASDMNRIEGNLQVLSQELEAPIPAAKTWDDTGIPLVSDYERLISGTQTVRAALSVPEELPETPGMPLNLFSKYNDLEAILLGLHNRYLALQSAKIRCGEGFYTGNTIGVI